MKIYLDKAKKFLCCEWHTGPMKHEQRNCDNCRLKNSRHCLEIITLETAKGENE